MDYKSIVEQAKQNPQQGFTVLYNNTYKEMKYLALKLVKNETDADDVLQEAYIKAWKNLYSLQQPERFQSWMSSIVVNTAKNHLKKKNPYLFSQLQSEDDGTAFEYQIADESIENHPELAYSRKETAEMVNMLLDSLDDEQRICVLMRYQGDTKIKDIAAQLGISENTVKSRLRYANKNMNAKAEEMKKKGYRFYGFAPLPLLILLLRGEMKMYSAGGVAVTAAAGAKAAGAGAKTGFFSTLAGKITAAVAVIAITATAATVTAVSLNKNKKNSVPVNTSAAQTVEATTEKKEEKVDLDKVVNAYKKYISEYYPDSGYDFEFIFVDGDDVPELYVDGEMTAAARFLLTYKNGKAEEAAGGNLSYKEKTGIFEMIPNHFQTQENYTVFELKNGKAKEIHYGQVNYNGSGDENDFTYTWDKKKVADREEFETLHKAAFDAESQTPLNRYDTFSEAVKALEKKTGYKTDSKTDDALYINELKNFVNGHNQKMKEMYSSENKNRGVIDKFSFYDVDCDGTPELFAYMTFPDGEGNYWRIWKENGEIKTLQSVGEFGILKEKYCMIVYGGIWEEFYCFNPADKHEASCELADGTGVWNGNPCSRETYLKKRNALADVNKKVKLKYYNSIDEAYKHYKN